MASASGSSGSGDGKGKKFRNRLAQEKSPYLLQHATNPVDWYPWGDEAFQKAKKENKPIFLSGKHIKSLTGFTINKLETNDTQSVSNLTFGLKDFRPNKC